MEVQNLNDESFLERRTMPFSTAPETFAVLPKAAWQALKQPVATVARIESTSEREIRAKD